MAASATGIFQFSFATYTPNLVPFSRLVLGDEVDVDCKLAAFIAMIERGEGHKRELGIIVC